VQYIQNDSPNTEVFTTTPVTYQNMLQMGTIPIISNETKKAVNQESDEENGSIGEQSNRDYISFNETNLSLLGNKKNQI